MMGTMLARAWYDRSFEGGMLKPGVVHRLDTGVAWHYVHWRYAWLEGRRFAANMEAGRTAILGDDEIRHSI